MYWNYRMEICTNCDESTICWWVRGWVGVHSEEGRDNPLPAHEADHTVLDIYSGSLHAQCNSNFTSFSFNKMYFSVTRVIIPQLNIFILCGSAGVGNLRPTITWNQPWNSESVKRFFIVIKIGFQVIILFAQACKGIYMNWEKKTLSLTSITAGKIVFVMCVQLQSIMS